VSIPDSVAAASTHADTDIDLRLAEQLIDSSLVIEDVARELLTDALRDRA
jgi:hypothetical protein